MLTWKEIISPNIYWYTDQRTGQPAKLVATKDDIGYWCEQGNKMLASGLSIPIPVEHQPGAMPKTASQLAADQLLNNAGWVRKYRVMPGDKLFGLCKIEDEGIANKLPRTIKWTSPYISSFVDGDGRPWKNVISHLALTSRPRVTNQQPFGTPTAALSLAVTVTQAKEAPEQGVFVSRAGLLEVGPHGSLVPHYPKAFSILTGGAALAFPPPKDDKPKEDKAPDKPSGDKPPPAKASGGDGPPARDGGEDKDKPPSGDTPDGEPPMPGMEPLVEEEMDLTDVLCDVMSILGVELPEDTTEDNLLQNLMRALMQHLKEKMPQEEKTALDGGTPPPPVAPPPS